MIWFDEYIYENYDRWQYDDDNMKKMWWQYDDDTDYSNNEQAGDGLKENRIVIREKGRNKIEVQLGFLQVFSVVIQYVQCHQHQHCYPLSSSCCNFCCHFYVIIINRAIVIIIIKIIQSTSGKSHRFQRSNSNTIPNTNTNTIPNANTNTIPNAKTITGAPCVRGCSAS